MIQKYPFNAILLACIAGLLFVTATGFPQNQNKTPTPPTPELRTDVRLVVLDVMVMDSHGQAIPNLKLEDFNLAENGVTQNIKNLEDHTAPLTGKNAVTAATPLPPGTYSNHPTLQSNMWNVIVVDMLNTPAQDQVIARQALRTFARQLPSGAPVALVVMTAASVKMLVPFTPNGTEISKLLDGDALFSTRSPLLDIYNADEELVLEQSTMGREGAKDTIRETEMGRLLLRVEQTLRSLDSLAIWLNRFPGKKNLYWLSAGFPLSAEPQTMRDGFTNQMTARYRESYSQLQHETDKRLEAARVAVFPLDIRGNNGTFEGIDTADVQGSLYAKPTGAIRYSDDVHQAAQRMNSEHAEMEDLAKQTGGIAHYNRNDLTQQLSDQFNQAQTYYTLSYSPTDKNWDGKYRKISLKLKDHSYNLYYRHGYFADTPPATPANPADAFTMAMRHGAPVSTSVLFKVNLDKKIPGKLGLHYIVDPHTLLLVESQDNRKSAKINCAVVEYDEAGALLGTSTIQVSASLRPDQLSLLESSGYPANQLVLLLPNAKWLAIGIQDANTGTFGTLQIAILPPAATIVPASAESK
jgi:VWFA-related protein